MCLCSLTCSVFKEAKFCKGTDLCVAEVQRNKWICSGLQARKFGNNESTYSRKVINTFEMDISEEGY